MSYSRFGRGLSKPPAGSRIDWAHNLARGLAICLPMNEGGGSRISDIAGENHFGFLNGAGFGPTKGGGGVVSTSNASGGWASTPSSAFIPASSVSIVYAFRKRDTGFNNCYAFAHLGGQCQALVPFGDGVVYWDFGGFSEGSTRLSVSGLSFGDDIWVFTTGARGMEIWQNGVKRHSNTANPSRSASTDTFYLGHGSGAAFTDAVDANLFYFYQRQLSPEECRWISAEPYAMLAAPQYRRFFVPTAPTSTTSYANTGGTGDRRDDITITATRGLCNSDDWTVFVDGSISDNSSYVLGGTGFIGKSLTFDFRTGKVVDEIKVRAGAANDLATWQPSGSNDGVNFTNIGSPVAFTIATSALLTFTNFTSYRYYRITGSSGTINQTHWQEIEFKIDQGDNTYESSTSYSNTGGTGDRTASITVTDDSGIFANGSLSIFVNGADEDTNYVPNGTGFITKSFTLDFGSVTTKIIDEIRLKLASTNDQAAWQVSGSNDGSSFADLGGVAEFPRLTTSVISFFNLTGYRYYRLTGASGTVSQTFWRELEFRIDDGPAVGGGASYQNLLLLGVG
jgi:hypothetical protein